MLKGNMKSTIFFKHRVLGMAMYPAGSSDMSWLVPDNQQFFYGFALPDSEHSSKSV